MIKPDRLTTLCLISLCGGMVAAAVAFATAQSIWVDESTQLSGLTLGVTDQWLWLSGQMAHPFTVPADRMPPMSYWLMTIWTSLFGLTEMSLRSFSIVMALCAAPALFMAGRSAGGRTGGLFAVAFLFSSPGFIIQTVEIRAYPIFFCLAAWAVYVLVRLVVEDRQTGDRRLMPVLTVLLVMMSYTHFYGMVMSGFVFLTLLAHRLSTNKPVKLFLICAVVGVVSLAGVAPFVLASFGMTGASDPVNAGAQQALADGLRLTFRVLSSPVLLATPWALITALGGISVLLCCLVFAGVRGGASSLSRGAFFVFMPLVSGLIVLVLIRTQVSNFAVLAPHYNVWMLPLASVGLAFAFGLQGHRMTQVVRGAGVLVILAQLVGLSTLMTHRTLYAHGAAEAIARDIEDPLTTLVIHDVTGDWGHSYFPLSYMTEGKMAQWLAYPDGRHEQISQPTIAQISDPAAAMAEFKTVVLARTEPLYSRQLARIVHDPQACAVTSSFLLEDVQAGATKTVCAYFAAQYALMPRPPEPVE